jgi:hypothetical protein
LWVLSEEMVDEKFWEIMPQDVSTRLLIAFSSSAQKYMEQELSRFGSMPKNLFGGKKRGFHPSIHPEKPLWGTKITWLLRQCAWVGR